MASTRFYRAHKTSSDSPRYDCSSLDDVVLASSLIKLCRRHTKPSTRLLTSSPVHLGQPTFLCLLRYFHQTQYPFLLPPHLHFQNIYQILYLHRRIRDPLAYFSYLWYHIFLRATHVFLGQIDQDWWPVFQPVCLYAQPYCAQHLHGCHSASVANPMSVEAADKSREEACYCWNLLAGRIVSPHLYPSLLCSINTTHVMF